MIGCEKIRVRIDDWLDGLLDREALGEVNDHLAFCEDCRRHFERHLMLANDLSALGNAADRMADGAVPGVGRRRPWLRRIAAVAACLALAMVGGYYFTQRQIPLIPIEQVVELPGDLPTRVAEYDRPAVPLGNLMVRPVDERRVRIDSAPDCIAVNVESSNPRVHIVWLYGNCAAPPRDKMQ